MESLQKTEKTLILTKYHGSHLWIHIFKDIKDFSVILT